MKYIIVFLFVSFLLLFNFSLGLGSDNGSRSFKCLFGRWGLVPVFFSYRRRGLIPVFSSCWRWRRQNSSRRWWNHFGFNLNLFLSLIFLSQCLERIFFLFFFNLNLSSLRIINNQTLLLGFFVNFFNLFILKSTRIAFFHIPCIFLIFLIASDHRLHCHYLSFFLRR